jgi:hypothetical protein
LGTDLIRVTFGRPSSLVKDGCRIFIAVHDEFHRRMKTEYRQQLRLAHPDMTPTRPHDIRAQAFRAHDVHTAAGGIYTRQAHTRRAYTIRQRNTGTVFRRINEAYRRWLRAERIWYAQFGLRPPMGGL